MAAEASEKLSEINNLELFLKKSTFRGRTGSFKNRPERARTSVKNAISRASEEINELNPTLARHLSVSIKTGYQCCYKPEKKMFWLM
jgi:hypothetical protein